MVDKYGTGQDPDCYRGTSILKNLLGIKDLGSLEDAEREITALAATEIDFSPPPYHLDYLCSIHETLFQDIYGWAGRLRTIDISKGATRFCNVNRIEAEAVKIFARLADENYFEGLDKGHLVSKVAELYSDINMLHPFREGNGRAQRVFFEHMIVNAGFEISWEPISQDEWLTANIAAVACEYGPMEAVFERCIGSEIAV